MSRTQTSVVRWTSLVIMVAGLGWVVFLLFTTIDHPTRFIPDSVGWLMLATLLLAVSMATTIFVFHTFMCMQHGAPCLPGLSARLFLTGQLLRYLPGRIWGVVYQVGITRNKVPAPKIVRVNIDMMVFILIGNSSVALVLLGYRLHWPPGLSFLIAFSGLFALAFLLFGGANWLVRLPKSRVSPKIGRLLVALSETRADPAGFIRASGFFLAGWGLYVTSWHLLSKVYPAFDEVDFVVLCAFYTLAAMIGVLSAITPAGLGVREAAFIILASASASMEAVAFFAVFARVWLLAVELVLLLLFSVSLLASKGPK